MRRCCAVVARAVTDRILVIQVRQWPPAEPNDLEMMIRKHLLQRRFNLPPPAAARLANAHGNCGREHLLLGNENRKLDDPAYAWQGEETTSKTSCAQFNVSATVEPRFLTLVRQSLGFTLVELMIAVLVMGVLLAIAMQSYAAYVERAKVAKAISEISAIGTAAQLYFTDARQYPDSLADINAAGMLDPWGNPYQYLNLTTIKGNGKARKDKNLVPLNTDFDLYSMGKDGQSVGPLTAKASRDDIVRASDGAFIGLASDY
jgi:general secretion pathway protein G